MHKITTTLWLVAALMQINASLGAVRLEKRMKRERIRHDSHNASALAVSRMCDTSQLEGRLAALSAQITERIGALHSEVRQSSDHLKALGLAETRLQQELEELLGEAGRLAGAAVPGERDAAFERKLELRIDNVAKGVQLAIAALRGLSSEIAQLRANFTGDVKNSNAERSPSSTPHGESRCNHGESTRKSTCAPRGGSSLPRHCKELLARGRNASGIYRIQPERSAEAFMALCDMNTAGGGWTYIHNRYEGTQDFYKDWSSYKRGFGNLGGEFWLGLENIHQLTGHDVSELLVELVDMSLEKVHAHYTAFSVGGEADGYALKVLGGYSGTAGDSLIYHAGGRFSTSDVDQDEWTEGSCAQAHHGAWWYRNCDTSNLNGKYLSGPVEPELAYRGMYWESFKGPQYSLLQVRMMVRPREDEEKRGN